MGAFRIEIAQRPAVAGVQAPSGRLNSASTGKPEIRLAIDVLTKALTLGRQLPSILVALLTPAALVALAMGLWRVGADLEWAGAFPIAAGFFSHWQVWIALSIALKMVSSSLLAWESRSRKIPDENRAQF
jgi:hypothetical protein